MGGRQDDPTQSLVATPALGEALARELGRKPAVLLTGHGIAFADSSLYGLVKRVYDFRMNAIIQQKAILLRRRHHLLGGQDGDTLPSSVGTDRFGPWAGRRAILGGPGAVGVSRWRPDNFLQVPPETLLKVEIPHASACGRAIDAIAESRRRIFHDRRQPVSDRGIVLPHATDGTLRTRPIGHATVPWAWSSLAGILSPFLPQRQLFVLNLPSIST